MKFCDFLKATRQGQQIGEYHGQGLFYLGNGTWELRNRVGSRRKFFHNRPVFERWLEESDFLSRREKQIMFPFGRIAWPRLDDKFRRY